MLWLFLACQSADTAAPDLHEGDTAMAMLCGDQPPVDWAGFGQGFFMTWCQSCHSATTAARNGAPDGLDFDTAAQVRQHRDAIQRSVVEEGRMPVGGGLSETDLQMVEILLWCGL